MSDAQPTIMHEGHVYIRQDLARISIRQLQDERDELKKLLDTYRQAVWEVKDRLSKLDNDQADWLNK